MLFRSTIGDNVVMYAGLMVLGKISVDRVVLWEPIVLF